MRAKKARETLIEKQARMKEVLKRFRRTYPNAHCSLDHKSPYQLLMATILSAQCTDERVNLVTPALFARFPEAQTMARAELGEIETLVKSTGFYKNKARSLVECSRSLVELYGGEVPRKLDQLTALRGVGRKTANVILGNAFNVPGLVVDTHVGRLSRRLGFTQHEDPEKVEQEMMQVVPRKDWTDYAHLLIYHGRARCIARKPDCQNCEVLDLCPRIGVTVSTLKPKAPASISGAAVKKILVKKK